MPVTASGFFQAPSHLIRMNRVPPFRPAGVLPAKTAEHGRAAAKVGGDFFSVK